MAWSSNAPHGGFSQGKPWLPVSSDHAARAPDAQEADANSMLNFYRRMIAYRKSRQVLSKGAIELAEVSDTNLTIIREGEGTRMLCAFNLSDAVQNVNLPDGNWALDAASPFTVEMNGNEGIRPAWSVLYAIEQS